MEMHSIRGSNLMESIGYKDGNLYIKLSTGLLSCYNNVAELIFDEILCSDNTAEAIKYHIFGKYKAKIVR